MNNQNGKLKSGTPKEHIRRTRDAIDWGNIYLAPKSLREAVQMDISQRIYTSYELEQLEEKENGKITDT